VQHSWKTGTRKRKFAFDGDGRRKHFKKIFLESLAFALGEGGLVPEYLALALGEESLFPECPDLALREIVFV
jgi:hypothetical protein